MTRMPTSSGAAILATLALAALAMTTPAPWLINESGSLPRGLYLRTGTTARVGEIVAVTPPPSAVAYLASLGAPPGAALLKRVAAGPREQACRNGPILTWPRGQRRALDRDRRGQTLPRWDGCRQLAADEVLIVGDTDTSFDSRYFGPVRARTIHATYREVLRW